MTVFVIQVIPEASLGRVSSEAYKTLEAAQKFIESRSGNPKKFSEYLYRDDNYTDYVIFEVRVV